MTFAMKTVLEAQHAQHDGEQHLRQTIALQATKELWPDTVAHCEQEHQEEHRFDVGRNRDVQLAHQDTDEQRAGHDAQAERTETHLPDPETHREHEEDGDLWILTQRVHQPVHRPTPAPVARPRCRLSARNTRKPYSAR